MTKPSKDPSISKEPHLSGRAFHADPSERRAEKALSRSTDAASTDDERIEQTVWDEPGRSGELSGAKPDGALDYPTWLEKRRAEVSSGRTWVVTFALAFSAGPWALLGAFYGGGQTIYGVLAAVVFAPVVEETMKVAAALYVVEKRPFLFRYPEQIPICALSAAITFSFFENLLYLHVYIPNPSPGLVYWRWSVCTAMHLGCSVIAGLGLLRVWRDVWERRARPRLSLGFPYLLTAVLVHGIYNAFAVGLHVAQFEF